MSGEPDQAFLLELLPAAVASTRLGMGIATWDEHAGAYRVLYANQALAEIFGAPVEAGAAGALGRANIGDQATGRLRRVATGSEELRV